LGIFNQNSNESAVYESLHFYSVSLPNTKYEKTLVAQNKLNLLLKTWMYNMSSLQKIQLKWI